MMSFTSPVGFPSADTTGIPISVEARRSAGMDASEVALSMGCDADICEPGGVEPAGAERASGGLGIAAAAALCDVGCDGAGAPVGANGASDWLQEAATRPSAARMSGRKILIMGAL